MSGYSLVLFQLQLYFSMVCPLLFPTDDNPRCALAKIPGTEDYRTRHILENRYEFWCISSPEGAFACCDCLWQNTLWTYREQNRLRYIDYLARPGYYKENDFQRPQPVPFIKRADFRAPMEAFDVTVAEITTEHYLVTFKCRLITTNLETLQLVPYSRSPRGSAAMVDIRKTPMYSIWCSRNWDWASAIVPSQRRYSTRSKKPDTTEWIIKGRCAQDSPNPGLTDHGIEHRVWMGDPNLDPKPEPDYSPRKKRQRLRHERSIVLQSSGEATAGTSCLEIPQWQEHIGDQVILEAGIRNALPDEAVSRPKIQDPEGYNAAIARSEPSMGDEALAAMIESDADYAGMMRLLATSPNRDGMQTPISVLELSPTNQLTYIPTTADWPAWPSFPSHGHLEVCFTPLSYKPEATSGDFYAALEYFGAE